MRLFTLTAGRTGTAWLSKFLSLNIGAECKHEQLGVDEYFLLTLQTYRRYGGLALMGIAILLRAFGSVSLKS